ncbi:MAG: sulfatase-like hydrolase/transferase [Paludibacteraceae bacterium]|nr:sulfatase-like hydrolase/transferase [Paludibacteraceae bacterium]
MRIRILNNTSLGAWLRFLLVVVLLAAKAFLFDRMVDLDLYVSSALAYFKWAAAVILALSVMWTPKRWPVFALLGLTDLWIIAQIIYYRVNHLFITWHLFTLTGNMEGFWSSIIPYCDTSLLLFPLLTCAAAVCFLWKAAPFRWWETLIAFLIGATISLSGSYLRWHYHKPFINGAPFSWEWINPCTIPQTFSVSESENERKATHYIHHRSILAYPLFMATDCIRYYAERTSPSALTEAEQAELAKLVTPQLPPAKPQGHLVILLLESFESWVLDAMDLNGDPVCPAMKEYIASRPVLYARDLLTQIQYGMSGDGQLIVNTGLYPIKEGVACIDYDYCTYPNIAHFYPRSAIVNPCRNVWNQRRMATVYSYQELIEPDTDNRFAWNDSIVIDHMIQTLDTATAPCCMMGISINGHLPFDSSPDPIELPDSIPAIIQNYLRTAHYTDRQVGRFLAWADTAEVMRNSTIAITGDHRIFTYDMSDEVREYGLRADLPFGTGQAGCPFILTAPCVDTTIYIPQAKQSDIYPTVLHAIGQQHCFWKGMGHDLINQPCYADDNYALRTSLADKLIRSNWFASPDLPHYIAHAGGSVRRYRYSNSLEAVRNTLEHGIDCIELDLSVTLDGQLVAWHDWNFEWTEAPTHDRFMAQKIYGLFTPVDFPRMDSILASNPQLTLVTDKISDPAVIDQWLGRYKNRVWVECFSDGDYWTLQKMGYHVLASRVPPAKTDQPAAVRNYAFDYRLCPDLSQCDGDCFALFGGEISRHDADSLFATDPRIRLVYIDFYE